eukprot:COSAG06_NODE_12820_length_1324_cov_5.426122_1_plen_32_part_10
MVTVAPTTSEYVPAAAVVAGLIIIFINVRYLE